MQFPGPSPSQLPSFAGRRLQAFPLQVRDLAVDRPAGPWASEIYRAGSPALSSRELYRTPNLSSSPTVLS